MRRRRSARAPWRAISCPTGRQSKPGGGRSGRRAGGTPRRSTGAVERPPPPPPPQGGGRVAPRFRFQEQWCTPLSHLWECALHAPHSCRCRSTRPGGSICSGEQPPSRWRSSPPTPPPSKRPQQRLACACIRHYRLDDGVGAVPRFASRAGARRATSGWATCGPGGTATSIPRRTARRGAPRDRAPRTWSSSSHTFFFPMEWDGGPSARGMATAPPNGALRPTPAPSCTPRPGSAGRRHHGGPSLALAFPGLGRNFVSLRTAWSCVKLVEPRADSG